jgi:uncharacterized coiled-coil protein SlyX
MNQSNPTLAKRIADLERQLSSTKDLLESSVLSEATAKQYAEEVDKQNQALAAQVEALRKALNSQLNDCINFDGGKLTDVIMENSSKVLLTAPQHHLRQVRADAGRAGFIAGYFHYKNYGFQFEEELEAASNQYHASILAGKDGE